MADSPRNIAVVGGGLAGLAVAHSLLEESRSRSLPLSRLHVLDPASPGEGGASAVAAGLLHPFSPKGRELWRGEEGFTATLALVRKVERHLGQRVSCDSGLLRLALTDKEQKEQSASCQHRDGLKETTSVLERRWLDRGKAAELAIGVSSAISAEASRALPSEALGAVHVPAAISIDPPAYCRGLWSLCKALGAELPGCEELVWQRRGLEGLSELSGEGFDAIVIACGARSQMLAELRALPITPVRGQNLLLRNEAGLRVPLICGKYLVPLPDAQLLLAGATFEYDGERSFRPSDPSEAEAHLRTKLGEMHGPASSAEALGCLAGVRALPPRSHLGYVPLVGQLPAGTAPESADAWLLTGLGSRGFIHHAVLGRDLATAILESDEGLLPEHVRRIELLGGRPGLSAPPPRQDRRSYSRTTKRFGKPLCSLSKLNHAFSAVPVSHQPSMARSMGPV